MKLNKLARRAARFWRIQAGAVSVETVIIFPILLWGYAAMFIYWDAFKSKGINLKATYTIADMLAREEGTDPIDANFIDGMNTVFNYLIRSDDGNDVRVSFVDYVSDPDDPDADPEMVLCWSHATGDYEGHTDISEIEDRLPMMPGGDKMIVVETRMTWTPPFDFTLEPVLDTRDMTNLVFVSPRWAPRLDWDDNGDGVADSTDCD